MKEKPKSISWKSKEVNDINLGWYEEATDIINDKLIFKFYHNKKDNSIYLYDMDEDVKYKFPNDTKSKAKGYTLAFKLMSTLPF